MAESMITNTTEGIRLLHETTDRTVVLAQFSDEARPTMELEAQGVVLSMLHEGHFTPEIYASQQGSLELEYLKLRLLPLRVKIYKQSRLLVLCR